MRPFLARILFALIACCFLLPAAAGAQSLNLGPLTLVPASVGFDYNEMPRVRYADDGTKHLVWIRGASFLNEGVFAMSDAGGGWSAPTMISAGLDGVRFGFSDGLMVHALGNYVVASWEGTAFINRPMWFARSTDAGGSWEPAVRADPDLDEERAYSCGAAFPDGRVTQVWMEYEGTTNDLFWRVQDEFGEFGAPSFPAEASPQVPCDCCNPDQTVLADGTVVVAYRNNINNNRTVWVSRSTDSGATFPVSTKLDNLGWLWFACPGDPPSLAVEGQNLLVVWKRGPSGVHQIFSARSTDAGQTFTPMTLVGGGDGSTDATRPRVAIRGNLAVAAWEARDPATNHFEIWTATSLDGGVTWGPEQMIPGDGTSEPVSQPSVAISPSGAEVSIVVKDRRDGTRKLYELTATVDVTTSAPSVASGTSPISLSASPNPFRTGTSLRFAVPASTTGRIVIHDLAGRRVRELTIGRTEGTSEIVWDGNDAVGRPVTAGVYYARLETSVGSQTRMIVRHR